MTLLYVLAVLQLVGGLVILTSTRRHITGASTTKLNESVSKQDLPSLSVCVPARNETIELQECLDSLVRSSYPKLEILVLDDQSQDRRTPEIIRQYAHDGVIFLAGKTPPDDWLAKNYAYDQMADVANGEILLFCGADMRFEPDSLTNLAATMQQSHRQMISLLPINQLPAKSRLKAWLIQPARYAWELALPRQMLKRPAVLSSCWLISRDALLKLGGFDAVKHKIVPESYFAREIAKQPRGYQFLAANEQLSVKSVKTFAEQRETAIRVRYPQMHRRVIMVLLTGVAELLLLVMPIPLAIVALISGKLFLAVLAAIGYLSQALVYNMLINLTYRTRVWDGLWVLPIAAAYDIWLLNYSAWQYRFGHVEWKGRDITNRRINQGSAQKP